MDNMLEVQNCPLVVQYCPLEVQKLPRGGSQKMKIWPTTLLIAVLCSWSARAVRAQAVPFDFDSGAPALTVGQNIPFDQTSGGVTAHFSSPAGSVFSVQSDASTGFRMSQFSGRYLNANNQNGNALDIKFDSQLTGITLKFATADFQQVEVPTTIQLTAYLGSTLSPPVDSTTAHGVYAGDTMPMGTLSFNSGGKPFDLVEIAIPRQPLAAGAFLVDNIRVTAAVTPSAILPQFAFGGGWYSAVYFTNIGASAVSFPVSFTADNGTPLTVPSLSGSSVTLSLNPGATALIEAPNVGPLTQGYVSVALPGGVVGYGVFRQSASGRFDQEAVVPLSSTSSTTSTLIWDDTSYTTSVAIVNPSSLATTVTIVVRDSLGGTIGTTAVPLAANSKFASPLRDLPGLGAMTGNRGAADFTVSTGNIAVLGLRFAGSAFTSIPTADR
jgi:hypothetical protein